MAKAKKWMACLLAISLLLGVTVPVSASAPAEKATAYPTAATVYLDGQQISFDAYSINNNNYFKLRDLAYSLNGTPAQFGVGYENNTITLFSNTSYNNVGGEMAQGDGVTKDAVLTPSPIYVDGSPVSFTAYYIGGNNYFKLVDVADAFGFSATYEDGSIMMRTATENIETVETSPPVAAEYKVPEIVNVSPPDPNNPDALYMVGDVLFDPANMKGGIMSSEQAKPFFIDLVKKSKGVTFSDGFETADIDFAVTPLPEIPSDVGFNPAWSIRVGYHKRLVTTDPREITAEEEDAPYKSQQYSSTRIKNTVNVHKYGLRDDLFISIRLAYKEDFLYYAGIFKLYATYNLETGEKDAYMEMDDPITKELVKVPAPELLPYLFP